MYGLQKLTLDKLAEVGDRHGNDDQQTDCDAVLGRVVVAPLRQDLREVATLSHSHKLPGIGRHLGFEECKI